MVWRLSIEWTPHRRRVLAIFSRTKKRSSSSESGRGLEKLYKIGHQPMRTSEVLTNKVSDSYRSQEHVYRKRDNDWDLRASSRHAFSSAIREVCPICRSNHPAVWCSQILDVPFGKRLELVQRARIWLNCIRAGHETKDCKFKYYRRCKLAHHTLLHHDHAPVAPVYCS